MTQNPKLPPQDAAAPAQDGEIQYRRLVEMSPDIVLLCDESGRILYVNLAGVEMLGGADAQALVGRNLAEIVHPDSLAHVLARLSELMKKLRELPFVEERFRRLDNTPFYGEMMAFLYIHQGAYVAHLVISDSTRRKLAEAQQRRLKLRLWGASAFAALLLLITGALLPSGLRTTLHLTSMRTAMNGGGTMPSAAQSGAAGGGGQGTASAVGPGSRSTSTFSRRATTASTLGTYICVSIGSWSAIASKLRAPELFNSRPTTPSPAL